MRRHAFGILAIGLLCAAVYGLARYGIDNSQASMLSSMCLRIGLVLGAIWLAFPQISRLTVTTSTWFLLLLGAIGMMIAARPKLIVVLGPIMLLLILLQFFGWLIKPLSRGTSTRSGPARRGGPHPL